MSLLLQPALRLQAPQCEASTSGRCQAPAPRLAGPWRQQQQRRLVARRAEFSRDPPPRGAGGSGPAVQPPAQQPWGPDSYQYPPPPPTAAAPPPRLPPQGGGNGSGPGGSGPGGLSNLTKAFIAGAFILGAPPLSHFLQQQAGHTSAYCHQRKNGKLAAEARCRAARAVAGAAAATTAAGRPPLALLHAAAHSVSRSTGHLHPLLLLPAQAWARASGLTARSRWSLRTWPPRSWWTPRRPTQRWGVGVCCLAPAAWPLPAPNWLLCFYKPSWSAARVLWLHCDAHAARLLHQFQSYLPAAISLPRLPAPPHLPSIIPLPHLTCPPPISLPPLTGVHGQRLLIHGL